MVAQIKIGKFIAELRNRKGMTQADLAKRLKTSQSAVARMEKGEQNFSTEMLSKISEALGKEIISLSGKSLNLKIQGGKRLKGTVKVRRAKNSAVGLLCASLLNKGKTILKNMPRIEEVYRIIEVMESLGVSVKWKNGDVVIVPPEKLRKDKLDVKAAMRTRSVLMFLGPLVHLFSKFKIPYPG